MRFLLPIVAALLALPALADVGPKPRSYAPGLEPKGDLKGLEIEMTSEEVSLVLRGTPKKRGETLVVDATFTLTNLGGATEIEEGFPVGPWKNMTAFSVKIDGAEAAAELVDRGTGPKSMATGAPKYEGEGHDFWYVWKAKHAAKAASVRVVHYEVELIHRFMSGITTSYVLHTGAPWKNPIGKATVRLRVEGLTREYIFSAEPAERVKREKDAWVWTFENFEPTADDDVRVTFNCEETWKEDLEKARKQAGESFSERCRVADRLSEVPFQNDRLEFEKDEARDYATALEAVLGGAVEKDGKRAWATDTNNGYGPSPSPEADRIFPYLGRAVRFAAARPDDENAKRALRKWVEFADQFLASKVFVGATAMHWPAWDKEERSRKKFDEDLKAAKTLLNPGK